MSPLATWAPVGLPDAAHAVAARGRRVVAALDDGRLVLSVDGGATWTVPLADLGGPSPTLLHLGDAVLAGTPGGVVRVSPTAGTQWAPVPLGVTVTALAGRRAATIAGTRQAGVYRSADGGIAWEAAGRGLPLGGERLRIFSASAGLGGLVVAHALGVSRSRDGGRSWSSAGVGLPLQIPGATLAADGRTLYASVGGRLYRSALGRGARALTWTEVYDGAWSGPPLDLLGGAHGVLYGARADPPGLVCSTDGGLTWAPAAGALPTVPVGLALAGRHLLAVGADGSLWRAPRPTAPPAPRAGLPLAVEASTTEADLLVSFALPETGPARLAVHDVREVEVARLVDGVVPAGRHRARLSGGTLPPGLYRIRLQAGRHAHALSFALLG